MSDFNLEQKIKASEFDPSVTVIISDAEVVNSRNSAAKSVIYGSLDARLESDETNELADTTEMVNARTSSVKSTTYANLDTRLEAIETIASRKATWEIFDDFNYRVINATDTPWILNNGSNSTSATPVIVLDQNGKIVLTTGVDASGTIATDGSQVICAVPVQVDNGGLVVETRLHINTAVTNASVNFGLMATVNATPLTTMIEPFVIGANDLVTANTANAACFVYDTSADTDKWFACAVESSTPNIQNGKTGDIVIEACEARWGEQNITGSTPSTDTGDFKAGLSSAIFTIGAGFTTGLVGSQDITATNLTTYTHIDFWFKSNVALDSGDFQVLLSATADCANPLETLNVPAISPDTWTYCKVALNTPANLASIISIGLNQAVDKGAIVVKIDNVKAYSATTYVPVAATYQTLRIEVSADGNTILYYINGVLVKTLTTTGVAISTDLYATVIANSTTSTSKTVDVDYIYVSHNR